MSELRFCGAGAGLGTETDTGSGSGADSCFDGEAAPSRIRCAGAPEGVGSGREPLGRGGRLVRRSLR